MSAEASAPASPERDNPSPEKTAKADRGAGRKATNARDEAAARKLDRKKTTMPIIEVPAENTALWQCLQYDDVVGVEELLANKDGGDVNMTDKTFGWSPTLLSSHSGIVSILRVLLDAKARTDMQCNEGNTPLMVAVRRGNRTAAKYLLSRKVDMDKQNSNGWTALHWAAMNGQEELCSTLLSTNADYNKADTEGRTACMWAARHGYLGIVEGLLACGLNLQQQDDGGLTVMDHAQEQMDMRMAIMETDEINRGLVQAAKRNDMEGMRLHIAAGGFMDQRDGEGWTPLMWSALHDSPDMMRMVVQNGGDPTLAGPDGESIESLTSGHSRVAKLLKATLGANDRLLAAAKANDLEEVEKELHNGAWVNARDIEKRSTLMWAAKHGDGDAIESLCSKSASLDEVDIFGWTAAHFAASSSALEAISALCYHGANFGLKTFQGDTCLHIAVRANDSLMMQLLLTSQANIEAIDVDKNTSLQIAAKTNLIAATRTLLTFAADVAVRDRSKRTPFHLAVINGHMKTIRVMMEPLQAPPKFPGYEDSDEEVKEETINGGTKAAPTKKTAAKKKTVAPPKEAAAAAPKAKAEPAQPTKLQAGAKPKAKAKLGVRGTGRSQAVEAKTVEQPPLDASSLNPESAAARKLAATNVLRKVGESPMALFHEAGKKRQSMGSQDLKNPLGAKAALKQADKDGLSSLHLAIRHRQLPIAQALLAERADPEAMDAAGNTILMEAVVAKMREIVQELLAIPVRVEAKNNDKQTALMLCQDTAIRLMLERFLVDGKIKASAAAAKPKSSEEQSSKKTPRPKSGTKKKVETIPSVWRVRFDGLPLNMTWDILEDHIKQFITKVGAPNLVNVEVVVDPITSKPRGFANVDFADAAAADICLRWHGSTIAGKNVQMLKGEMIPGHLR
eukprot:TRINITY_DN29186_c0_g1_i1.p1 TRINITY_DN29186_c0_g1~~TRINITY_DN29186_c0_g1_i1.p1  ORF type:complete len:906 (-),score=254.96 TRINITY_DN29186_c0_g1_i1:124-2841(-)